MYGAREETGRMATRDESEREVLPLHCAFTWNRVSTAASTVTVHIRRRLFLVKSCVELSGLREIVTIGSGTGKILIAIHLAQETQNTQHYKPRLHVRIRITSNRIGIRISAVHTRKSEPTPVLAV